MPKIKMSNGKIIESLKVKKEKNKDLDTQRKIKELEKRIIALEKLTSKKT